jgi:hypothetical protein
MRMLVLAAILVTGCASTTDKTPGLDPGIAHFEQESRKIDERENQCIGGAVTPGNHEIADVATTPGASADLQAKKSAGERERRLFECRAKANRERAELSARERADYQERALEERDRNSLMMILTTSTHH